MTAIAEPYRLQQVDFFKVQSPLLAHAANVASQSGEDGIISRIFELLPPGHRYFVEFGAWDGKFLSNCWNLAANVGWGGCFIEANAQKFQSLIANHGANEKVRCVNRFVAFDGPDSLDNILEEAGAPKDFDLLSIDVDGTDYFIWESLQTHRPHVVVIEFNPTIPNDVVFVQSKSSSVNQGCSLLALIVLGRQKGYELVCCTGWNAFFVRAEHYARLGIPSNAIFDLYKPVCDGRIFHGYDSFVYTTGMPKLIWSGVGVQHGDIQVLPPSLRRFGDAQAA
jgi:hypothetical protein